LTADAALSRELKSLYEELSSSHQDCSSLPADRKSAIQEDARGLKATIDLLGQESRDAKNAIAGFVYDPLDAATHQLLIPPAWRVK
jgi:hypothetical protein